MQVIPKTYKWAHPLGHRTGPPPGIVWHHAAGTGSPDAIHATHVAIGDSGIAYHYYVRKDGRIYRGRPEWAMGAHCLGHNDWLGICAEGAYHVTKTMPPKQLAALMWLHDDIHRRRGGLIDKRHKDMPNNSTACPGTFFPFAKITAKRVQVTGKVLEVPVPVVKPKWWKRLQDYLKRVK